MGCGSGPSRAGRWEAAGAGRESGSSRVSTAAPGSRGPQRRLRLPRLPRSPIRQRQADHQTERGGSEAVPATAAHRDARTARRKRRDGHRASQPDPSGVGAYYRTVVSKHVFTTIVSYLWWLTIKWAVRNHRIKPKKCVTARYYGAFNPARTDRWVFGDRGSGAYLTKLAWTPIVRHQMVDGFASPDDPDWADYWATRKRRRKPPIDRWGLIQLERQHGRCPLCRQLLLHADHSRWRTSALPACHPV